MKVLVPVKRVIDYNVKVRVKADGSGVDLANVKMSMNPFDEISVEQAIRLKEAGQADEIIAVSIGVKQAQETLRTALAMGADRAILVVATDDVHNDIEPLAVAKIIAAIVKEEQPGLVLCGKQAIDNDMNATGQMTSALLGWSQATFASEVDIEGDHFYEEGGLEYLFGISYLNDENELDYKSFWARDRVEEKRMFEEFMEFVLERWKQVPDMHIFHYAPYEPSAIKRLASRSALFEQEVDQLLRSDRFTDLFSELNDKYLLFQHFSSNWNFLQTIQAHLQICKYSH